MDSGGKALSAAQQDYFKDSVVRDKNGKLLPVYHSTDYDFNEFNADESWDSFGFHFGTLKAAKDRGGRNIKKCYLNLTNVLEVDEDFGYWDAYGFTSYLRKHPKLLNDIKIDGWEEMMEVWESEDFDNDPDTAYWDAEYGETIRKALYNSKYDGVKYINAAEDAGSISYMAFYPNQIKLTTNTNPTENADIRYALSSTHADGANVIDNTSQNSYNSGVGGTENEQAKRNQSGKNPSTGTETGANDGDYSGRRGISFFNDLQGTRRISEISRNEETVQRVKNFASMVYAKAETVYLKTRKMSKLSRKKRKEICKREPIR